MNLTLAPQNSGVTGKAIVSMMPCLLCLYVNGVMLVSLGRKAAFLESPRYLLFGHLLLVDSSHLLCCVLLYLLAVLQVRLSSFHCLFLLMLAEAVAVASPLTLAAMSLERYVAICLPLRHAHIVTPRRTAAAAVAVWGVAAVDPLVELLYYVVLDSQMFTLQEFCQRRALLGRGLFSQINMVFNTTCFLLAGGVILKTYISIVRVARWAAAGSGASKARRTVLLHMFQLGLCLSSTMFNMMNAMVTLKVSHTVGLHIQYSLFLCLQILPRFLNPLIYGLRDPAFRRVFNHYFLFGLRTH